MKLVYQSVNPHPNEIYPNQMSWTKSGAPVMGLKTQARLRKRQNEIEKELEKRAEN